MIFVDLNAAEMSDNPLKNSKIHLLINEIINGSPVKKSTAEKVIDVLLLLKKNLYRLHHQIHRSK